MLYYIGAENSSGIKCSSLEDLLQRISEAARKAEDNGQEIFEVSIEAGDD